MIVRKGSITAAYRFATRYRPGASRLVVPSRHVPKHQDPAAGRNGRDHRRAGGRRPPVRPQDQRLPHAVDAERRGVRGGDRRDRRTRPSTCSRRSASRSRRGPTAGRRVARRAAPRPPTRTPADAASVIDAAPWWVRPGLDIEDGRLRIAGHDAEALAREHGTPLFVYDLARFGENARRLQARAGRHRARRSGSGSRSRPTRCPRSWRSSAALGRARHGRRASGSTPARRARWSAPSSAAGARTRSASPARTSPSATSTCCSARGVHVNLDAISQIERYGRRAPGPARSACGSTRASGAGYNDHLDYAGDRPTKFGIGPDRLDEAVAAARRHDLTIDTVHFHAGSGWLARRAARVRGGAGRAVEAVAPVARRRASRSPRSTSVAGSARRPARTSGRSTSTPTPPPSPATSAGSTSSSPASPATTSARTPRSCSARS